MHKSANLFNRHSNTTTSILSTHFECHFIQKTLRYSIGFYVNFVSLDRMATLSPLQTTQNDGFKRNDDGSVVVQSSSDGHAADPSSNSSDLLGKARTDGNAAFNDSSISSPHELTDWVDNVLDQLESRFSVMSGQVENRMKEMSERIDALESSIEELITGASAPVKDQT